MAEGGRKTLGGRRYPRGEVPDEDSDEYSAGQSRGFGGESQGVARPAASGLGGTRGGVRPIGGDPAIVKAAVSCQDARSA